MILYLKDSLDLIRKLLDLMSTLKQRDSAQFQYSKVNCCFVLQTQISQKENKKSVLFATASGIHFSQKMKDLHNGKFKMPRKI